MTSSSDRNVGREDERRRVLVVDDESENCQLLQRILRNKYIVDVASSAEEALKMFNDHAYDVVISDERMPGLRGSLFLKEVRDAWPSTVRVLATGYADHAASVDAINLGGVSGYLSKPLTVEQVTKVLEPALRLKALNEERGQLIAELESSNEILKQDLQESERSIRRAHAQLMQSDRMMSLGLLAAGVSHEINNPLAYVMANQSLVREELLGLRSNLDEDFDSLQAIRQVAALLEILDECDEGAKRIQGIIQDLKMFSRPKSESETPKDIRPVIESALNMAWNQIKHRARLVKDFSATPRVLASETKLAQVFLNLTMNALQSIPPGDTSANEIRISTQTDTHGFAVITVSDTGEGIPSPHLERIFEPFFTTKPTRQGTGLGLAICYGIVTDLGGAISVESDVGKGTRFTVKLPPAQEEVPEERSPATDREHEGNVVRGRVLVVDDERAITRVFKRLLGDVHDVMIANSGREAMELIRNMELPDLIISDLLMPEGSGMELFENAVRYNGVLRNRFAFMTGSAFTREAREFLETIPQERRIQKPFDIEHVRGLVRAWVREVRALP